MRVTPDNLGAWVLRCNPTLTDLDQLLSDGFVHRWCVADNYRSRLMGAGQPVLFWVTGALPRRFPRGFWGLGTVAAPAAPTEAPFDGPVVPSGHRQLEAPLDIRLWTSPVPVAEVTSVPGLAGLEILRQPQMSNPSFVSVEQFELLRLLLRRPHLVASAMLPCRRRT